MRGGVTPTLGIVLKGLSIKKVENHRSRHLLQMVVHGQYLRPADSEHL